MALVEQTIYGSRSMSSFTVPIPPDLNPVCRVGKTVCGRVLLVTLAVHSA
jgi:hypothetical protein